MSEKRRRDLGPHLQTTGRGKQKCASGGLQSWIRVGTLSDSGIRWRLGEWGYERGKEEGSLL